MSDETGKATGGETVTEVGRDLERNRPKADAPETPPSQPQTGSGGSARPKGGRKPKRKPKSEEIAHLRDKEGFGFEEGVHEVDRHGWPKVSTKTGLLIRRGGRKPKGWPGSRISPHAGGEGEAPTTVTSEAQRAAGTAEAITTLVTTIGALIAGEEGRPIAKTGHDERAAIREGWERALIARIREGKRVPELPPELGAAIPSFQYLGRCAQTKTGKGRIRGVLERARAWYRRLRYGDAPEDPAGGGEAGQTEGR